MNHVEVELVKLSVRMPSLRPVLNRALALLSAMNRAGVTRATLVDARGADGLLPVIMRSNVLVDALERLCEAPSPEAGENLGQLVDGQRAWFDQWRRERAN